MTDTLAVEEETIDQLRELGLTIYVTCKGYDASSYVSHIDTLFFETELPDDYDGDTHEHLLTSLCKPTKITRLQVKSIDLDFEVK